MKDITFEGLKKELLKKEETETTKKDLELILTLEKGNHEVLLLLDGTIKNDAEFMLPLLYAYKNLHGTFDVYRYCGTAIQDNWDIADQVVMLQPALIAQTNLINDPDFIVRHLEAVPELRSYLSNEMLQNSKVRDEIERIDKPDPMIVAGVTSVATIAAANVAVALGPILIAGGLYTIEQLENASLIPHLETFTKEDFHFFQEVSEEKRDDASYLTEIVSKNIHAFEYIVEHLNDFGLEGLDSVKEQVEEDIILKAKSQIERQIQDIDQQLESTPEDETLTKKKAELSGYLPLLDQMKSGQLSSDKMQEMMEPICSNLDEETGKGLQQYMRINTSVTEKKNDADYVKSYVEKSGEKKDDKISYIARKADTFGLESLQAVKGVTIEHVKADMRTRIQEEISREDITEKEKSTLQAIERFIDKVEKRIQDGKTTTEHAVRLVSEMIKKMDPKYQKLFSNYIQMDDSIQAKREAEMNRGEIASSPNGEKAYLNEKRWDIERASSIGTSEVESAASDLENTVKKERGNMSSKKPEGREQL